MSVADNAPPSAMEEKTAIATYEMLLKSNEADEAEETVIRLVQNETATVSCRIYDSGFEADSLTFLKNGKNVTSSVGIAKTYQIKEYRNSKHEMKFTCSAKRVNGKYQTRRMRVAGRLLQQITPDDVPCAINTCKNGGLCLMKKDSLFKEEWCNCPVNFRGDYCQYTDNIKTDAAINPNYVFIACVFFVAAVIFGVLFCRENVFRLKSSKTAKKLKAIQSKSAAPADGSNSLQEYEICDGREDGYVVPKPSELKVIDEYDNVPVEERRVLLTRPHASPSGFPSGTTEKNASSASSGHRSRDYEVAKPVLGGPHRPVRHL